MEMGMGMGGMERIFPAIKLRGLPYDVTEEDIRMFIVRQCKGCVSSRPARSNVRSFDPTSSRLICAGMRSCRYSHGST